MRKPDRAAQQLPAAACRASPSLPAGAASQGQRRGENHFLEWVCHPSYRDRGSALVSKALPPEVTGPPPPLPARDTIAGRSTRGKYAALTCACESTCFTKTRQSRYKLLDVMRKCSRLGQHNEYDAHLRQAAGAGLLEAGGAGRRRRLEAGCGRCRRRLEAAAAEAGAAAAARGARAVARRGTQHRMQLRGGLRLRRAGRGLRQGGGRARQPRQQRLRCCGQAFVRSDVQVFRGGQAARDRQGTTTEKGC